ncbi:MAG: tyrosine-type recombinase/integrase [Planctomycetota bacterium]
MAEKRPVEELLTVRVGLNRGQRTAKVRPEVLERARRLGRERRLAYTLAIWAGLRRSELAALAWGDADLDSLVPVIRLRAETTKSKRADRIAIHPQLADELRALRPVDARPDTPVVSKVPGMKAWRADLKAAGIDYGDETTGYADLHAQRMTLSTMLAAAGVPQRVRQAHMRHTDPRLTENTYMDEALLPVAAELAKVPAIPAPDDSGPEVIPLRKTGTDGAGLRAGNMQEECGVLGHGTARGGTSGEDGARSDHADAVETQSLAVSRVGTKRKSPAPLGTEPAKQRVIGLEPTTFTLAT